MIKTQIKRYKHILKSVFAQAFCLLIHKHVSNYSHCFHNVDFHVRFINMLQIKCHRLCLWVLNIYLISVIL